MELTPIEAEYVDKIAATIVAGMLSKGGGSYNTDYFRMISQTAYQLAFVMFEVRKEKFDVIGLASVEDLKAESLKWNPTAEEADYFAGILEMFSVADKDPKGAVVAKRTPKPEVKAKGGRPKGSKNKTPRKKPAKRVTKPRKKAEPIEAVPS